MHTRPSGIFHLGRGGLSGLGHVGPIFTLKNCFLVEEVWEKGSCPEKRPVYSELSHAGRLLGPISCQRTPALEHPSPFWTPGRRGFTAQMPLLGQSLAFLSQHQFPPVSCVSGPLPGGSQGVPKELPPNRVGLAQPQLHGLYSLVNLAPD